MGNLASGLAAAGWALDGYNKQLDNAITLKSKQFDLARAQFQLQAAQKQAQLDAAAHQLEGLSFQQQQQADQPPPSPYGVNPPQGGGQQQGGIPGGLPGSTPMPQQQGMMPQGPQQAGAPNPMQGGQRPAMGGAAQGPMGQQPQAPQQDQGFAGLGPPPTLQSLAQAIAQNAQRQGINAPPQAIMAAARQALPQAVESYKLRLETVKAQQSAQDREASMAMHQQDHQDTMQMRQAIFAAAQAQHAASNQSKGWDLFQGKDGNIIRINKDTGEIKPVDVSGISKVGAPTGGKSGLQPEALDSMADQYLAGDKSVLQNLGRGAQGAADVVALRNKIAEKMKAQGISGAQQATKMAEFSGLTAGERSLGTRSAQMGMAVDEAQRVIPLALKASDAFPRTQFVPLNKAIAAVQSGSGDPNISRFVAANQSLINVYARAMSPTGVPTVSDKDHARDMLSVAQTKEQYAAVLDQMQKEMQAAQKAPGDVKVELGGGGQAPAPSGGGWSFEPVR
jgi:hypothetical protein